MSQYRADVVFTNGRKDFVQILSVNNYKSFFDEDGKTVGADFSGTFNLAQFGELCHKERANYALVRAGTHSCRETLLNSLYRIIEPKAYSTLKNPTIFVEYFQEGDGKLSDSRKEKITRFYEKFLSSGMNQDMFSVATTESGIVLFLQVDDSRLMVQLWTLSMILWIFRNENILDDVLKKFTRKTTLTRLFEYMTVRFLEEDSWGNYSNRNLYMSIFCYHYSTGEQFRGAIKWFLNGPQNAGCNAVPVSSLISYIKNIYNESGYGKGKKSVPNSSISNSDFQTLVDILV